MASTSVPTRWHRERLTDPPPRLRRLARLAGVAIRESDADVIALRDGLLRADPPADDFVAWAGGQPAGHARDLFERVVEDGLSAVADPPDCLVRWFEPLEREPKWLDHAALKLACKTASRAGTAGGTVLTSMALMGGYRSSAAVKPLAMTGALERMVVRRIAETSRFVLDVVESETLSRSSKGFKSACRVRLMHARVRRSLASRRDWDEAAWGVPINQTDMAATQLEFSSVYLTGLMALGFRFTPAEREAVMHLWRYVGLVMGVDDALMPRDFAAGVRQMFIHGLTNPYADADSRALAKALHDLPASLARNAPERLLAAAFTRYRTAVTRYTLGHEVADDIALPRERLLPLLALPVIGRFALETARRNLPGATEWSARRGLARQQMIVNELIGAEPVRFVPYAEREPRGAPSPHAEIAAARHRV